MLIDQVASYLTPELDHRRFFVNAKHFLHHLDDLTERGMNEKMFPAVDGTFECKVHRFKVRNVRPLNWRDSISNITHPESR